VGRGRAITKQFTKKSSINMWGPDGPASFGFSSLSNDPRADVPRLKTLFDYMDLNDSGDISLDEMQWFLELQGQSMKRTEFQMIVEELGISGANAPLTRDKFVEFLLNRLANDDICCFEVRASEKVPIDQNRVTDAKELRRVLKEEQEKIRMEASIKSRPRTKSSWSRGVPKTNHDHGKTEFIVKSWEELERLRATLPDYLCAQLGVVKNYDPEADVRRLAEAGKGKKKKRRTTRRPGTAPAGRTKGGEGGTTELAKIGEGEGTAFDKYYVISPEYQRPIDQNDELAVSGGVEIKEMVKDRPSTATTRRGGEFPYNQQRLSREQWESKKNPEKYRDPTTRDEEEEGGDGDAEFRTVEKDRRQDREVRRGRRGGGGEAKSPRRERRRWKTRILPHP